MQLMMYPENARESNKNIHIQRCTLTSLQFGFDSRKMELISSINLLQLI